MLAEAWESELIDDGFHATYDWELYHRMYDHRQGKITLDSLWSVVTKWHERNPKGALPLRFVENHDEPRSAEKFGWPEVKPYLALIFTLPGIPLIYAGQEVGATHKPTLFEKETIDWEREGGDEVWEFIRGLIRWRNISLLPVVEFRKMKFDQNSEVLQFHRSSGRWGTDKIVTINFSKENVTVIPNYEVLKPFGYSIRFDEYDW